MRIPEALAFALSLRKPSADSFLNHRTLELGRGRFPLSQIHAIVRAWIIATAAAVLAPRASAIPFRLSSRHCRDRRP
jgi:hypothetical protein